MIKRMSQTDRKEICRATFFYQRILSLHLLLCTILIATLLSTTPAFAHGAERGLIMLLPTNYYLIGGGLAVFLSFMMLAVVPNRLFSEITHKTVAIAPSLGIPKAPVSFLTFLLLAICVLAGFFSVHDPLSNPLPLVIWTAWWVGMTLAHAIFGNLWLWLNPWTGVLSAMRKVTGSELGRKPIFNLPKRIGYVPSILQFSLFAWFELVSIAPEDPPRLASAVLCYWLFNFIAIVLVGQTEWMKRGEPFSVFFRMIGMFSPLRLIETETGRKIALSWPGALCLTAEPLPLSGTIFILLTLGTASFDGFAETFTWLGFIDVNPLEFPGRSGVMLPNTLGLFIAPIVLAILFYASVAAGFLLAGRTKWKDLRLFAGRLVYSIVPISIAFHSAHYLTQLLINGQYLIVVMSDPLALDWNLFGTADMHVTASFLQNLESVRLVWTAQTAMIVAGHVAGIIVAHGIATAEFQTSKNAAVSQMFLAAAMVFYTVFGLWLLSTPTVG